MAVGDLLCSESDGDLLCDDTTGNLLFLGESVTPPVVTDDSESTNNPDFTYFNNGASYPAGNYNIMYREGGMQFFITFPWQLWRMSSFNGTFDGQSPSLPTFIGYQVTHSGGTVENLEFNNGDGDHSSQSALESACHKEKISIAHTGGPIGIKLLDFDGEYNNNEEGSPNPTFVLIPA